MRPFFYTFLRSYGVSFVRDNNAKPFRLCILLTSLVLTYLFSSLLSIFWWRNLITGLDKKGPVFDDSL